MQSEPKRKRSIMRFFRVQSKGYSFDEMAGYDSLDGGDDGTETGLAVSGSASGLDGGSRFGGAWDAMDEDDEVVVLEGHIVAEIYDGYRIRPTREVARFTIAEWREMLQSGTAQEYE
jgi:hypothetical protein